MERGIPQRCLYGLRLLSDCDEQFVMREHGQLPVFLIALHTIEAERQPVRQRKVHRFIEVELYVKRNQTDATADSMPRLPRG